MRVLLLAHNVYPYSSGGVEVVTHQLATNCQMLGHEVSVAIPRKPGMDVPCDVTYEVVTLDDTSTLDPDHDESLRMWRSIQAACLRVRPDIVHIEHLITMGWPLLECFEQGALPYVLSLHDYWYLCPGIRRRCGGVVWQCVRSCSRPGSFTSVWREWVWRHKRRKAVIKRLSHARGRLLPVSHAVARIYEQEGVPRGNMYVLWNGIDLPDKPVIPRPAPRKPLRLGFIGYVTPDKGIEVLIGAVSRLKGSVTLEVRGYCDPAYTSRFSRQSHACGVTYGGLMDRKDLCQWFGTIDVLVVPSMWEETYGLVVQEALQSQVPVIASDIGGIREQITDEVNGYLVKPGSVSALCDTIARFCSDPEGMIKKLNFTIRIRTGRDMAMDTIGIYEDVIKSWRR